MEVISTSTLLTNLSVIITLYYLVYYLLINTCWVCFCGYIISRQIVFIPGLCYRTWKLSYYGDVYIILFGTLFTN